MYRPSRLDLPKSGTIEYAFVRSSTATYFKFFDLSFEYFVGVQSPKPRHTKVLYLILVDSQAALFSFKPVSKTCWTYTFYVWRAVWCLISRLGRRLVQHLPYIFIKYKSANKQEERTLCKPSAEERGDQRDFCMKQ